MYTTKDVQESLNSLDLLSNAFEKMAADPKNYNNPLSSFLDQYAYEMRRMKSEASEFISIYGGF